MRIKDYFIDKGFLSLTAPQIFGFWVLDPNSQGPGLQVLILDCSWEQHVKEYLPCRKKKSGHEILSEKKIVGKKVRHWQNNSSLYTDEFFCLAIWKILIELKKNSSLSLITHYFVKF